MASIAGPGRWPDPNFVPPARSAIRDKAEQSCREEFIGRAFEMMIIGRHFADATVLRVAAAAEERSGAG